MRILFCCEFYFPSMGGVQEVMRQIAERMVAAGHDVTVATTKLPERGSSVHNGVKIEEFLVAGNFVAGIRGEVDRYREFVKQFNADAILIKAAQQWTFDALWPVLEEIRSRKVFIPCGFSALYEPEFAEYFRQMPSVLGKFDHLIFYAEHYRDLDFTKKHGLTNWSVIPNGASEKEFFSGSAGNFREKHGIAENSYVFLTVGSMTGAKGHKEIAEAFCKMSVKGRPMTLILNGNQPPWMRPRLDVAPESERGESDAHVVRRLVSKMSRLAGKILKVLSYPYKAIRIFGSEGYDGVYSRAHKVIVGALRNSPLGNMEWVKGLESYNTLGYWVRKINRQNEGKQVFVVDLPRDELIQAYFAADLFVFASHVEYSPLVLFESAAAGTPFLSVPAGNAEEIAEWTKGGIICPAPKDKRGYTRVVPAVLAREMERAVGRQQELAQKGALARGLWEKKFTWDVIAKQYEQILVVDHAVADSRMSGVQ